MLTENDLERYSRQILYPVFGEEGQKRLQHSHVVVAGAGGLGSPISIYLSCAGVGRITIIDNDFVELSNLNRQILHWDEDIGKKKVDSAEKKLLKLNPTVEIIPVFEKITEANVINLIKGAQAVIDGMDNFKARFLLNAACVAEKIPFIHGGVWGLLGELTTIIPGKTACFACIYPEISPTKRPFPVFGATPGLVASLQVMEAIKLIADFGTLITGKMLYIDGFNIEFNFSPLTKNPHCKVCGVGSS